jgi:O-antigen/teichoic acid export membrane protein
MLIFMNWGIVGSPRIPKYEYFGMIARYSVRSYGMSLAEAISMRIDQLTLTIIAPASVVAVYSIAMQGSELLMLVANSLATALLASFLSIPTPLAARRMSVVMRWILVAGLPASTLLGIVVGLAVPMVFGPEYDKGALAALLLAWAAGAFAVGQLYGIGLLVFDRPGLASLAQLGGTVAIPCGMLLISSERLVTGTAVVTLGGYLLFALVSAYMFHTATRKTPALSSLDGSS